MKLLVILLVLTLIVYTTATFGFLKYFGFGRRSSSSSSQSDQKSSRKKYDHFHGDHHFHDFDHGHRDHHPNFFNHHHSDHHNVKYSHDHEKHHEEEEKHLEYPTTASSNFNFGTNYKPPKPSHHYGFQVHQYHPYIEKEVMTERPTVDVEEQATTVETELPEEIEGTEEPHITSEPDEEIPYSIKLTDEFGLLTPKEQSE